MRITLGRVAVVGTVIGVAGVVLRAPTGAWTGMVCGFPSVVIVQIAVETLKTRTYEIGDGGATVRGAAAVLLGVVQLGLGLLGLAAAIGATLYLEPPRG
jgi:hypothetical protein